MTEEKQKKGMAGWLKATIALLVIGVIGVVGYYGTTGELFQGKSFKTAKRNSAKETLINDKVRDYEDAVVIKKVIGEKVMDSPDVLVEKEMLKIDDYDYAEKVVYNESLIESDLDYEDAVIYSESLIESDLDYEDAVVTKELLEEKVLDSGVDSYENLKLDVVKDLQPISFKLFAEDLGYQLEGHDSYGDAEIALRINQCIAKGDAVPVCEFEYNDTNNNDASITLSENGTFTLAGKDSSTIYSVKLVKIFDSIDYENDSVVVEIERLYKGVPTSLYLQLDTEKIGYQLQMFDDNGMSDAALRASDCSASVDQCSVEYTDSVNSDKQYTYSLDSPFVLDGNSSFDYAVNLMEIDGEAVVVEIEKF